MWVNLAVIGRPPHRRHSAEVDGKNIPVQRGTCGDQTSAAHTARAEWLRGTLPVRQSCNCSHVPQELLLNDTFSEDCRDAITKGMQWPHAMAFPILDVLRSAAIKSPSLNPVQFLFFGALLHPPLACVILMAHL
jgi:hypothetical protein